MGADYNSISDFVGSLQDDVRRIAICGTSYNDIGGVARVIEQQASELRDDGYDVEIFALEGTREPPEGVLLHSLGRFETSPYKEVDKLITLASPSALRFIQSANRFDLIIAHRFPFSTLGHAAKVIHGVPYVYWSHPSGSSDELFEGLAHVWARVQHHLETKNYAVRRADCICAVSEESGEYIETKTGREATVVPNTITESRFEDVATEETINERFVLTPEDTVVLHVGRISPRKNIHRLVDIFQEATDGETGYKLLLVGEESMPEYSERVRRRAGDDVVLTGFVNDETLAGIYNRSDVYATCSLSEGWGLPLSEASYFDLEIVAFESIPAVQSLRNAHHVTEEDYDEFREHLIHALGAVPMLSEDDE
ncbi:galactosyl-transferase RfpB-like protein [Halobellus salinus]|uniref:Galactosyl-transferase RfpB-like protein n=1 Tax=Halobellus salinus TaxID=931585 RepID=A0A830EDV3_9EURY|nr:glycosyltransferase family 4 protein [Halobellus salinus]GGI95574.1 galactosyl-transferase RfpB-like protein [Halobellus salinus]SMP12435.1 1,2-diacylglycerol 3-alpha-glucosyltransferase [Halobellus salinus]